MSLVSLRNIDPVLTLGPAGTCGPAPALDTRVRASTHYARHLVNDPRCDGWIESPTRNPQRHLYRLADAAREAGQAARADAFERAALDLERAHHLRDLITHGGCARLPALAEAALKALAITKNLLMPAFSEGHAAYLRIIDRGGHLTVEIYNAGGAWVGRPGARTKKTGHGTVKGETCLRFCDIRRDALGPAQMQRLMQIACQDELRSEGPSAFVLPSDGRMMDAVYAWARALGGREDTAPQRLQTLQTRASNCRVKSINAMLFHSLAPADYAYQRWSLIRRNHVNVDPANWQADPALEAASEAKLRRARRKMEAAQAGPRGLLGCLALPACLGGGRRVEDIG